MTDGDRLRNLTERLDSYLRAKGRRVTFERHAVLDTLCRAQHAMSSADVCRLLDESGYHVAPATVYNALTVLCEAGIVRKSVSQSGRRATMVYSTGARAVGMVLKCTECESVRELRDAELMQIIAARKYPRFTPGGFTLQITGVCSGCQRRMRGKSNMKPAAEKSKTKRPTQPK